MSNKMGISHACAGIITGASSGIGKALALELARKYKAKLVITARTESDLERTKEEVEKRGGEAVTIYGDIGKDDTLPNRLVEACASKFGAVHLIVNNAGLGISGAFVKLTPADWERVFRVNFFAPLYLTYAAMPFFQKQKYGKIVNIASVAGKIAFPGSVCYAASKFALTGMSEGLAAELTTSGIDVITVCPGWVRTEFFEKNQIADYKNPTLIAQKNDFKGLLMRYVLSITPEQVVAGVIKAMEKGGSSELIMTGPGIVAERFKALFPDLLAQLLQRAPIVDNQ
jgi:short-subunit dehydrogenase